MATFFRLFFLTFILGSAQVTFCASGFNVEFGKPGKPSSQLPTIDDQSDEVPKDLDGEGVIDLFERLNEERNATKLNNALQHYDIGQRNKNRDLLLFLQEALLKPESLAGVNEIVDVYLRNGASVNAIRNGLINDSTILCWIYEDIFTEDAPEKVKEDLKKIGQTVIRYGGKCNDQDLMKKANIQELDQNLRARDKKEKEEEQARKEFAAAQEFFNDNKLARPLPKEIIQGPLAEFLGVPTKQKTPDEQEKESAADSTKKANTSSTPVPRSSALPARPLPTYNGPGDSGSGVESLDPEDNPKK